MNALDYFTSKISFRRPSDITGRFDIRRYRMLQRPAEALDNPRIKRETIFKASGCMGTVFLEMTLCFDIERTLGDIQVFCQTDDDAKEFTKTRAEASILGQPGVARMIQSKGASKSAGNPITSSLWLFTNARFVRISGPSESNIQSKQVHRIRTDESHMYERGVLKAIEARMGGKWNRHEMHFTTAPNKGADVDKYYMAGSQQEFCLRCLKCANLIWPLWEDYSREFYNGETIFQWKELQSENATLDSLRLICPHCQNEFSDDDRTRFDLQTDGDYILRNPGHSIEEVSFRWSCFAFAPIKWTQVLMDWRIALNSERMGNFKDMEEFEKKRLCMSYTPKLHFVGTSKSGRDYKLGDNWITEEEQRQFGAIDVQAKGGRHYWALCDTYNRAGDSRRVNYCKLENWTQVISFQRDHSIKDSDLSADLGHEYNEVLSMCANQKWIGMQSGDSVEYFLHPTGEGKTQLNRFYGPDTVTDAYLGQRLPKEVIQARRRVRQVITSNRSTTVIPNGAGFGLVVQWSKKNVGFAMLALKGGLSGKYFGIAADMDEKCPDYLAQLHTYIEDIKRVETKGLVGFTETLYLRQLSEIDHAFPTACQILVMVMRAGYFSMDFRQTKEQESAA